MNCINIHMLCAVTELEERLDHMQIGAPRVPYDSESEETENYSDRSSSATDEVPSAFQEYIKGMVSIQRIIFHTVISLCGLF